MKRRNFFALLGGAAAWPLAARAQQAGKLPTIGLWAPTTPSIDSQRVAAFVQRLRELGWLEGRTVKIEYRWSRGPQRARCRDHISADEEGMKRQISASSFLRQQA
jgi:putative tryptophan/tyrosine transport system substrate-binding protein